VKTPTEVYTLLENADPVVDAPTLDTSALVARIETELGDSAAASRVDPIRQESIAPTGTTARPIVPTSLRRLWRGPIVAVGTAAIILSAVLGVGFVAGWFGTTRDTEPYVADTVTTTSVASTTTASVAPTTDRTPPATGALPPAVMTLSEAPESRPVRVSTAMGDFEFSTLQFPPGDEFAFGFELAATPYGPVAIEDSMLWWSTDFQTWQGIPGVDGRFVTVEGDDLIVGGDFHGAVRFAWNGDGWTEQERLDLPGWVDQIVFGPRGAVSVGGGAIFYSADGVHFTEAEHGPSKDVFTVVQWVPEEDRDFGDCRATFGATANKMDAVLATDAGFVVLASASHPDGMICAPLLWFSPDGNTWDLVSPDSPFGEISSINSEIAERDGRFIATGEVGGQGLEEIQSAIWVSDDGLMWQRAELPNRRGGGVVAGDLGWMLGGDASPEEEDDTDLAMWFSTDGLTWDGPHHLPQPLGSLLPGWRLPQLAIGSDAIFGIGSEDVVLVVGRLQD
jgi:hypothetical protein